MPFNMTKATAGVSIPNSFPLLIVSRIKVGSGDYHQNIIDVDLTVNDILNTTTVALRYLNLRPECAVCLGSVDSGMLVAAQ